MTQEQQRIAIAQWCGYQRRFSIDEHDSTVHWHAYDAKGNCISSGLPDYLNDLNAIHEAEMKLSVSDQRDYLWGQLLELVGNHRLAYLATAAQRCEALCRTLWPERWMEDKP